MRYAARVSLVLLSQHFTCFQEIGNPTQDEELALPQYEILGWSSHTGQRRLDQRSRPLKGAAEWVKRIGDTGFQLWDKS